MSKALIVVDVQRDFCEGGSLAVAGGAGVAAAISAHLADAHTDEHLADSNAGKNSTGARDGSTYDHVVATRDHHIDPGDHFSVDPNFTTTWPVHCEVGTAGVDFHPDLDVSRVDAVFDKGEYRAAYSGFEGTSEGVGLADWLHEHDVEQVTIVGIATDYCVRATALDAATNGFEVVVDLSLTAGVARPTTEAAMRELADAGVQLRGEPVLS